LAQTEGVRALIVDSDLRQPCATDYLGIEANVGLSEVLGGQLRVEDAIVRLDPAGLYLLPGGKPRDDVAELLSGPTYARVLSEVRRMFDYIIIDAPPLGIFTDANVLMNRADGALLVVRAGKTKYNVVDKLLEQLPKERLMGVVLNRAEEQPDPTSYYYQHRYYNKERRLTAPTNGTPMVAEKEKEVAIAN
jgi:capsular exopolysaccharide synthesis family protein